MQGSEDRWHDALRIGAEHHLRLALVDALEGLAIERRTRSRSSEECLRLYGAARRLRDECQYRWRYPSEQKGIDASRQCLAALNSPRTQADAAQTQGLDMGWPEAVQYARRARGERKRPRHGWAALTPTEFQVVELVAQGLTNPQIAERLIMGRATVKTHLEHIFAKLGVTTRTELALQAARRNT